jgi:peptidylprolyl isomerase
MPKFSLYTFMMLFLLFISFLMAGASSSVRTLPSISAASLSVENTSAKYSLTYNYTAILNTTMGNIVIGLFDDMPITTGNFKNLTQHGIYDDTIFHRVVHNFVIQGGDVSGKGITVPTIPDELPNKHSNVRGSVAMAKTNLPNSATSQFYINLVDNLFLDSYYSVFGQVVQGMDVVDSIGNVPTDPNDRPLQNVTILKAQLLRVPRTWIVDDDGPADFSTIQEAINAASDGDTILVKSGTYYERILINKTINLVGDTVSSTIIDGGNGGTVVEITSDLVTISSFTIRNSGYGWTRHGIYVYKAENVTIRGNWIDHTCHNIKLNYTVNTSVIENTINGTMTQPTMYGIRVQNSINCTISSNHVSDCVGAVHLENATECTVSKNFLQGNNQGIRLYTPCTHNEIRENTVYNNTYDGMVETVPYNSTLFANSFFHNNFIENKYPFIYKGTSSDWDNGYPSGGNHWDRYNGTDSYSGEFQNETGSDGIGDTPYVIDVNNQDNYPFLQPNGWSENLTKLSFSLTPNPAYAGQTVTMIGNLTDRLGHTINNTKIDVYVNSSLSGTLFTNSSGWFAAFAKVNVAGTYNVTAVFTAENYYPSSHMESLVVYEKLDTKVSFTFSPNPVGVGQWVLMAGNLTDTYDNPIGHAPLEMYVKSGAGPWRHIGNISTDSSGKIWAFGKVMSAGTYQIAAVYTGSYKNNLSYRIETLIVNS